MSLLQPLLTALRRKLLGVSPDEIRYTIEDVRAELRALRSELKAEVAAVHRRIDALPSHQDQARGPELPVAEA